MDTITTKTQETTYTLFFTNIFKGSPAIFFSFPNSRWWTPWSGAALLRPLLLPLTPEARRMSKKPPNTNLGERVYISNYSSVIPYLMMATWCH